jgi:hypothetical protein
VIDTACMVCAGSLTSREQQISEQLQKVEIICEMVLLCNKNGKCTCTMDKRFVRPCREYLSKTFVYVNCPIPPLQNYINFRWLSNKKNRRFNSRISRIHSRIQEGLAHESGALRGLFDLKTESQKSSCHCPFKCLESVHV